MRDVVSRRTEKPSFVEPGSNSNHGPVGKSIDDGYSSNKQEITVLMKNYCTEGTKEQYITSTSGEDLGRDVLVRH